MVRFYEESRRVFKQGKFNIREWASNSKEVMERAEKEKVAEKEKIIKVLGIKWDIHSDRFLFCTTIEWNGKFTKRAALAFSCTVFDPLGILLPVTTRNKVFLQALWRQVLKWDESFEFILEGKLKKIWIQLVKNTKRAVTCQFDRQAVDHNPFQ